VNRARSNHLAHYEERLMLSRREIKWLKKFLKNEKRRVKRKIYKISRQ
jgi:hypothetical protein